MGAGRTGASEWDYLLHNTGRNRGICAGSWGRYTRDEFITIEPVQPIKSSQPRGSPAPSSLLGTDHSLRCRENGLCDRRRDCGRLRVGGYGREHGSCKVHLGSFDDRRLHRPTATSHQRETPLLRGRVVRGPPVITPTLRPSASCNRSASKGLDRSVSGDSTSSVVLPCISLFVPAGLLTQHSPEAPIRSYACMRQTWL